MIMSVKLLETLVDSKLVLRGEFTLKSGEKSDIYVNLKDLISHPGVLLKTVKELALCIKNSHDVLVCGVPLGGIPLATGVSLINSLPQILLRSTAKTYGTKKLIEGTSTSRKVVLIEDVVTTGSSVKDAISILKQEGYDVVQVISVVYRGNTDADTLFPCTFNYLYNIDQLQSMSIN